jgi:hypothetical protein
MVPSLTTSRTPQRLAIATMNAPRLQTSRNQPDELTLDPARNYQPTGAPKGPAPRRRNPDPASDDPEP